MTTANASRTIARANTPARWQAALQRARTEGVQVRQLAGCGMWIATSGTDTDAAYELTPWSCECHAGQFGDPVCKHRAVLLAKLGRLQLEPEPEPPVPAVCTSCQGTQRVTKPSVWGLSRLIEGYCPDCEPVGIPERPAAEAA